jgi:hypothetical protein
MILQSIHQQAMKQKQHGETVQPGECETVPVQKFSWLRTSSQQRVYHEANRGLAIDITIMTAHPAIAMAVDTAQLSCFSGQSMDVWHGH